MWNFGAQTIELGLGLLQKYSYPRLVKLIQQAENAGYDVLWCANEKFYRDMWVTTGLVAAQTARVKIGTFIAEPYSYHPAMIATAIATVDEASNGRAILLLGAGGIGLEAMGMSRREPVKAVQDTIQIVRQMLTGEPAQYEGQVFSANGTTLEFDSRPDLPIWVASRGNRMLKMAGQYADGVMLATYATPRGVRAGMEQVLAERDLSAVPITVRVDTALDDDAAAARAAVKPMMAGMIRASYPNKDFIAQAGLEISESLHETIHSYDFTEVRRAASQIPEEIVDAFAWAGTPEQVAEKVAAIIDMGITRITFLPHETTAGSTETVVERFAGEVMPRVQALLRG